MITPQKANKILAGNPFRGGASLVLRKLLQNPSKHWTGSLLAKELGLGVPWINRVLNALEAEQIVERGSTGIAAFTRLINPDHLLKQWTTLYRWKKNKSHLFIVKDGDPVTKLKDAAQKEGWSYAVTAETALRRRYKAALEGPDTIYLSPSKKGYHAYQDMLKTLQNDYGFHKVLNHPDICIIEPTLGRSVYFETETHGGIIYVSLLQLYLDISSRVEKIEMSEQLEVMLQNKILR